MYSSAQRYATELRDLVDDLRYEVEGGSLYFAVDPHEAYRFCFPGQSLASSNFRESDVDKVCDDQAALDELFSIDRSHIILREYLTEIEGLTHYYLRNTEAAQQSFSFLSALVDKAPGLRAEDSPEASLQEIERHFNIALALVLGQKRIGADRLAYTFDRLRKESSKQQVSRDISFVDSLSGPFDDETLADQIVKRFSTPTFRRKYRTETIASDARAISRLIRINVALDEQLKKGNERAHFRILYVSSAERSSEIFQLHEVRDLLVRDGGRKLSFLRSASYFLQYRVGMGRSQSQGDKAKLLNHFEAILGDLQYVDRPEVSTRLEESKCSECILITSSSTGAEGCSWARVCRRLADLEGSIASHRRGVQNLGLLAQIAQYGNEIAALKKSGNLKLDSYVALFNRAVQANRDEPALAERALNRIRELHLLFLKKREFRDFLTDAFLHLPEGPFLREGRDIVSSVIQYLPLYPSIPRGPYRNIVDLVVEYFRTPPNPADSVSGATGLEGIRTAYKCFLDLDIAMTGLLREHELVRCYLYMAFPKVEGDAEAHRHALAMRGIFGSHDGVEFSYVLLWTSRRLGRYEDGVEMANVAITQHPEDARLHHGLGLLYYSWAMSADHDRSIHINRAISSIQHALMLYQRYSPSNRELVAICHKDLALFHSEQSASELFAPEVARQDLAKLSLVIPEDEWYPMYPEFYHAKAQVLLAGSIDSNENRSAFREAHNAMLVAISLYNKPAFVSTLKEVERKLTGSSVPRIDIVRAPRADRTGAFEGLDELVGLVADVGGRSYAVVVYARTDKWYIQWFGGAAMLENCAPVWRVGVHVAQEYAALLVDPRFSPEPEIDTLPAADTLILASCRRQSYRERP